MDSYIKSKAEEWLNSNIDEESKHEIRRMLEAKDQTELTDAFYQDLEFGTGGLRGIMGIGSNRMNKYTVGKATQGLSNYLIKAFPGQEIKVAIAYDSRNNSDFSPKLQRQFFLQMEFGYISSNPCAQLLSYPLQSGTSDAKAGL
jgi:phosphoglucomutase